MDTLFIPGWLITFVIVAILVLILLVKGYVNAKPNEVVVITGLPETTSLAWESWLYDSLCRTTLLS